MRISCLDSDAIAKIAAGEVVERPASVVKELIENSIDAESSSITVEIRGGGIDYIRVSDDGSGIESSQAENAFRRHYTSKIHKADDLFNLNTNGFRGEALASVAAVSKIELITRTDDEEMGIKAVLESGIMIKKDPAGAKKGTTIIVQDLFFNVLPRKKFLKSEVSEAMAVVSIVNKMALSHPEIKFKCINNNKTVLFTIGDGNMANVLLSIYGRDVATQMFKISNEDKDVTIEGYISKASLYHPNRKMQSFFVNGRYIKDYMLQRTVEDAYKGLIPIGKFPSYVINIKIAPDKADFNIHPAKLQIKIDPKLQVEDKLYNLIRTSMLSQSSNMVNTVASAYKSENIEKDENISIEVKESPDTPYLPKTPEIEKIKFQNIKLRKDDFKDELKEIKPYNSSNKNISLYELKNNETIPENKTEEQLDFEQLVYKSKIFGTYLIMEQEDTLYLIDQHAAHERVQFEKFMAMVKKNDFSSQQLLTHIIMDLDYEDADIIKTKITIFSKMGFDIEFKADKTIMIKGVPVIFNKNQGKELIYEILQIIKENKTIEDNEEFYMSVATKACRSAIKANDNVSEIEILTLIKQLNRCKNKYTCPHGRPIFVKVKRYDMEKLFKRVNP